MKILMTVSMAAGILTAVSCSKEQSPAQYEKENISAVLHGASTDNLFWECDGLETVRITLEGEGLTSESVQAVTDAETTAFNIDVNGNIILVSPKTVNTDASNDIEEVLTISVSGSEPLTVALKQNRMNKPMILSIAPDALSWAYDGLEPKTVTVSGLNLDGVTLSVTSDAADSDFGFAVSGTGITVTPESPNDSYDVARSETVTVSAAGGNSMTFTVRQARMPSPPEVLYSTTFENTDKPEDALASHDFTETPATYTCDGKQWTMRYADVTSQYVWASKKSHVLARVYKETDQQPQVYSGNLLSDTKIVTSFTVDLARRNANEGWCKVDYSLDGTVWTAAGEDFQALQSGTDAGSYEFDVDTGDTDVFMIRVTYYFKEIPSAHAFLNFEGVTVMGY